MDFTAFSHGQIQSKQWLCETLETFVPTNAKVAILGCWYNVLGLMMLTRNHSKYQHILGIDKDPAAIDIANKVCNGWMIQPHSKIKNIVGDANNTDLGGFDVVINCSPEHMHQQDWFSNISQNTVVCIQSSDLDYRDDHWDIVNPTRNISDLVRKYPLKKVFFANTKSLHYGDWGYNRLMLIGVK